MIKIGIELPDYRLSNIDISAPERGNPGVGGSEFLFVLLAYELEKKYNKEFEVYIMHYSKTVKLPSNIDEILLDNDIELIDECSKRGFDILIHQVSKSNNWYNYLSKTELSSIAWAHIYLTFEEQMAIEKCKNVKRVIFVGKEQYDSYMDEDIICKASWIFNMLDSNNDNLKRKQDYENNVTYIGSLVPAKGFHVLAKIWPQVVEMVPNAKLHVIGSGKVYNRGAKLGRYGIAQDSYEELFMPYITNKDGNILDSVIFHGIMGEEKKDILLNTAVGIANPTALTETFCVSAIEMELIGVPVVSKKKWGLLDTVVSGKTGYLFLSEKDFASKIILLLKERKRNKILGDNARYFVKKNFDVDVIMPKWYEIIKGVVKNEKIIYDTPKCNFFNDYKWIKIIIRIFRFELGLKFIPSFNTCKKYIKNIVRR